MRFPTVTRLALAATALVLVASGCNCRPPQISSKEGEIVVIWRDAAGTRILNREATYDFGHALVGQRLQKTMTLQNIGDNTLTLSDLVHTDGDEAVIGAPGMVMGTETSSFEAEFKSVQINPSETVEFSLFFTPKGLKGDYLSTLTLSTEGTRVEDSKATLTLKGNGEAGACDLPTTIDFGKVAVGETFPFHYAFNNPTSIDANASVGGLTGDDASSFGFAAGSPMGDFVVTAMSATDAVFTFSPTEMRDYTAQVVVHGAGECPDTTVTLHGTGSDETLSWSPLDIDYGFVNPGSETLRDVVFVNPASAPITLTAVTSTNTADFYHAVPAGSDATTFTVPGGGVATPMHIACNPSGLGEHMGSITFQTGLRNTPSGLITLRCVGGGPRIKVTPRPTLAFGRVGFFPGNTTFSVQRKINVQNVGSRPATNDPTANLYLGQDDGTGAYSFPFFELSGPDAEEFQASFSGTPGYNPATGLIATAGQNFVDLVVTLKPLSAGPKSATVTIYSNDPSEPTITVDVTADAQTPPPCNYTVTPATGNFGLVTPGTTKDIPISVTNLSSVPGEICYLSGIDLSPGTNLSYSIVGGAIAEHELQPQETFQIVVRVAPTGTVPMTLTSLDGFLQFNTSSGARPLQLVPLHTSIGPSCLTITPDPMNYGTVRVGCNSATRTFNVYNTCSTPLTITGISMQAGAGQPAGGPDCPGTTPCPEFRLVSTPNIPGGGLTVTPGGNAPVTFSARYGPIDVNSDSGAIAIDAIQNGQSITYLVGLQGTGDTTGVQVDTYTQDLQPKADILLVIDDSGSMQDKQNALAANFGNFISYAQSANVDYQIGVVTTTVPQSESFPGFPTFNYTNWGGHLVKDPQGSTKILRSGTAGASTIFSRMVKVGTDGSGYEQPLNAATLALTPPVITAENAGLVRTDANLAVVIVSDASDQSPQPVSYYENLLRNVKGFQRASYFTFSAISPRGAPTSSCSYDDSNADSARYDPIVTDTAGVADEICNSNWAQALQNLGQTAFGYRNQFYLNNTPDLTASQVVVKINGVAVPSGCPTQGNNTCAGGAMTCSTWCFDTASNSVKFDPTAVPAPGVPLGIEYTQACLP